MFGANVFASLRSTGRRTLYDLLKLARGDDHVDEKGDGTLRDAY